MRRFRIEVVDREGKLRHMHISAPSEEDVDSAVAKRGWQIRTIEGEGAYFFFCFASAPKFSTARLAFFFSQLAMLLQAGLPVAESWRLICREMRKDKAAALLEEGVSKMERGMTLSAAMEGTGLFPASACRILAAGEYAGTLEGTLQLLGAYYERVGKTRQKIVQALIYPLFLLVVTSFVSVGAVLYILPVFAALFSHMQTPLPAVTRLLLSGGELIRENSIGLVLFLVAATASIWYGFGNEIRRGKIEGALCQCEKARELYLSWCWQRFSLVLAMQLGGTVPLTEAMRLAADTVDAPWFRQRVYRSLQYLEGGLSLNEAVRICAFDTPYVGAMLRVAESTGNYEAILQSIAAYYSWRLESLSVKAGKALEPLMLLIIGTIVGIVVLCLLLPLLAMTTELSQ
ncbi:type II secretion system F family protein [Megasphaera vaginalis (ex Srinivasan et al. 2021)]|uniref:Type II secretion system protein F n=1 Tax=Megasphaera vaginalis (ex Srinivasan et al. 2021) TaxID=1111454 RepID=U7URG2_9FIRM|nr:type II secretion system F family protein [Megasphaera vaginalis (ex Srinivasan et al. 2021)]ERT62027.1 type II secretion system protein F [Megasphaera vaginalis (ex Srinivasan et al. 2021)]